MKPVAVIGGTGPSGRFMIAALNRHGLPVRAVVRNADRGDVALGAGADSVAVADLADPAALAAAFEGAGSIQMTVPGPGTPGPGMERRSAHEPVDRLVANAVAAAGVAGVEHFVLNTVLQPFAPAMPHHMEKARAEAVLRDSDLSWTILQPATYAQNFLTRIQRHGDDHLLPVPYALDAKLSPVDLHDVGEVCVRVHSEPSRHSYAAYELAGPEVLDHQQIAAVFSEVLGTEVRAVRVPVEEALAEGLPLRVAGELVAMFAYYDACGFKGNPNIAESLLGRKPTSMKAVLERSREDMSPMHAFQVHDSVSTR